jgi:hypothetical protein
MNECKVYLRSIYVGFCFIDGVIATKSGKYITKDDGGLKKKA